MTSMVEGSRFVCYVDEVVNSEEVRVNGHATVNEADTHLTRALTNASFKAKKLPGKYNTRNML